MRDLVRAWKGELGLTALLCLRVFCIFPGVSDLYQALVTRLVRSTGLFDEFFYLENNPDIAEAGVKGVWHYVIYGDKEGRSPMPFFDTHCYREVVGGWTKNLNALLHYSYVGRHLRVSPGPWFDVQYYLTNNKDVARAGVDPLIHYMNWGGAEGRAPCTQFDSGFYLKSNPDVCDLELNPLLHYLRYGRLEGRRCLPESGEVESHDLLNVEIPKTALPSDNDWEGLKGHDNNGLAEVDVVIPVYKGMAETLRCIYSVLAAESNTRYELVVINDGSPEQELVNKLERLAGCGLFTLISNARNRGFVYTANKGLLLHADRDVVLLNSDTEVYDGWLDRLKSAAGRNAMTATVTPLSNNATISSYPRFPEENPFPLEIAYEELDSIVSDINEGIEVEAPTGVGFCMYVKRKCMDEIGVFDEKAFGKGYGEENDFCQRAIKKGWRNVIAADVFVRHFGSVSFQGEKAKLSERGMKMMDKKHRNYRRDVSSFIARKPLADVYQKMDFCRLLRMRREKNVLFVSHGRGGGTERYMRESAEGLVAKGYGVYTMRPCPDGADQVVVSHHAVRDLPNLPTYSLKDAGPLEVLLEDLRITQVHIHSFVDYSSEAPSLIENLLSRIGVGWQVFVHDYEAICPRINLIDEDGAYCGEPDERSCNRCLLDFGSGFVVKDIVSWRAARQNLLLSAEKVIVPDSDVAVRLNSYYPDMKMDVLPHDKSGKEMAVPVKPKVREGERLKVVVVGAISKLKGYEVLLRCARDATQRHLPIEFYLLGYSLNDRVLESVGVKVVGKYVDAEALHRLEDLNPHAVFLPSIAPETYSYTLSLALRSGYPIFAFDIGAISSRLRAAGLVDGLMPLGSHVDEKKVNSNLVAFRESVMDCESDYSIVGDEYEVAVAAVD